MCSKISEIECFTWELAALEQDSHKALLQKYPFNREKVWGPTRNRTTVRDSANNVSDYATVPRHYDVVLSSYMRGGSTLAGLVLGHRSDSFYVYEPLWKIARWVYWRGNDTVCRSDRTECRKIPSDENPDPKFMDNYKNVWLTGSLALAQKILYDIYDCQLNDFDRLVFDNGLTARLGGPSWASAKDCISKRRNQTECVNQSIPNICKNAKHHVTKVLRFSVDNFESLLKSRDDFKVIHLFRDPRAIMNSRIETSWYPLKDTYTRVFSNAESLCKKMLVDFHEGKALSMKYPDRFKFLYYEDLNDDPLDKVKEIYKYLGMSLDESKYSVVKGIKVFDSSKSKMKTDREKNTAFWWRKTLKWDIVKKVDTLCTDVYDALGYKTFSNSDELRNLKNKSFHIPSQYMLMPTSVT